MKLPTQVDLRPDINFVEDQGSLGTCNPFAKCKALQVLHERDGRKLDFSELYLYYYARLLGNSLGQEGSSPELALSVLKTKGCCLDASWPYTSPENTQPPVALDAEAAQYKITTFSLMNWFEEPLNWVKTHLAQGKPVNFLIHICGDFDSSVGQYKDWRRTVWLPTSTSRGDHEVVCIGYDDRAQMFLMQNSWGPNWADGGFFGISYQNFMDAKCVGLVDCITGFYGNLHPAPYFPSQEIISIYQKLYRKDITDPNDEGVQYWAHQPDGKRELITTYLRMVNEAGQKLLNDLTIT